MRILSENAGIQKLDSLTTALEEIRLDETDPLYELHEDGASYGLCSDSDKDAPNAGWTWSTWNKIELKYYNHSKEDLRKWGYVMWDKERLDQWKILLEDPRKYGVIKRPD